MDRGEADMFETMKATFVIAARAFEESRVLARRARIRRQWEADDQDCAFGSDFEEEEKTALETLKSAQFSANFLEFSDDEKEVEMEPESSSRRKRTAAEEDDEEDDEHEMYEDDDDQDVDDDENMEEESEEVAESEGGDAFGHHDET